MSNAINGQLITHDSEGAIKRDYLYRVSIKALIYNDAGQILVVKEDGRPLWDLPGGGMDYGETFESALKRELYRESCMKKLAIRAIFAISFLTRRTRFMLSELMLIKFVFLVVCGRKILIFQRALMRTK